MSFRSDPEVRRAYQRKWKAENRDKVRAYGKAWRKKREAESPEAKAGARAAEKRWRARNPTKVEAKNKKNNRNNHLLTKYGITEDIYHSMLSAQKGVCAICSTNHLVERFQRLCVDHDHISGKVRELLCDTCNKGLGCFKDNTSTLRLAIAYLEKHLG